MRHDFLSASPLAVAPSAPRMREAPGTAALVTSTGLAQRLAPRQARALAPAVALAAVAAPTHQHRHATACAGKCPCAVLRLPSSTHACLAAKASTRERAATCTWTTTCAGAILRAHSRCTRVGRGGSNNLPIVACRRARSVKRPRFYRVFDRTRARSEPLTARDHPPMGAGAQPQYKPSSIKPASGAIWACRHATPRDPISRRLGAGGCAPSNAFTTLDPALGQFR
jgi:hypothetical protein